MNKKFYKFIALVVALAFLLAACGSSADKESDSAATSAVATEEPLTSEEATSEDTTSEPTSEPEATETDSAPAEPSDSSSQEEAEPEPDPVPEPEPDPIPEPEPVPEPVPDPIPEPEPVPEPDPVPEPEPVPQPEPEPEFQPPTDLNPDLSVLFPDLVSWPTCTENVEGFFHDEEAKKILDMVNEYRIANGVDPLTWNEEMEVAAKTRAAEASIYWSHTRPDGTNFNTVARGLITGENLGKGYPTAELAFQGWINSEGHRENILWPKFKSMGVAFIETRNGWFWAQEFGG